MSAALAQVAAAATTTTTFARFSGRQFELKITGEQRQSVFLEFVSSPHPTKELWQKKGEDNFAAAAAALSESGGRSRRQSNND